MQDILIHGNCYSYIDKMDSRVVGLYPIPATLVTPQKIDGQLLYFVAGVDTPLTPDQVLHIPGLPFDGIRGLSVIANQARTIGVAIATEELAARFFSSGTVLGGHLEYPGVLDDNTQEALKEMWHAKHQGVSNSYEVPVLAGGLKFVPEGVPPEQAQFLESRKYSAIEICRLPGLRIPQHMVGEMDRSTWGNIEWQGMAYVRESLRRWVLKWENECNRKLPREDEKQEYYCELDLNDLQRGDQSTRYKNYATGIQWGWLTGKRVAEIENIDVEGLNDTPLLPLNMVPTSQLPPTTEEDTEDTQTNQRDSWRVLVEDCARRTLTKEKNALQRLAKKHLPQDVPAFEQEASHFVEDHAETIRTTFRPVYLTFDAKQTPRLLDRTAEEMKNSLLDALAQAVQQPDPLGAVLGVLETRNEETFGDYFFRGSFE